MPSYRYEVEVSGEGQTGTISADSAQAAAAYLREQGMAVLAIAQVQQSGRSLGEILSKLNYRSGPTAKDVLNMTTELAVMVRAGISLRAAVGIIAEQAEHPKMKQVMEQIAQDLESGKPFSEAIAAHPKLFNALYVNMVRASEMSGSFSTMLDRIAAYMAQQIETRAMVRNAMIYPGVIAVMAVGVTIFLLTFVLPRFTMVFKGKEAAMPWPTIFLMDLSAFMVQWWWAVLLGLFAMVMGVWGASKTQPGSEVIDRIKLRIPILSTMFRALYITRSLHTLGELIRCGVPMLDTLSITAAISGNVAYRRLWQQVHDAVQTGQKIQSVLSKTTLIPRSAVHMIGAGEESGKLGEVLSEIVEHHSRKLRDAIKTSTGMIEPLMIVVMGSIVGFIAMAIILPIFRMSSLVK